MFLPNPRLVGLDDQRTLAIEVYQPAIAETSGEGAFQRGQRAALFSDAADNKRICEAKCRFDPVRNTILS